MIKDKKLKPVANAGPNIGYDIQDIDNKIKAVLFASGDPFEDKKLISILGINQQQLENSIERINQAYINEPFIIAKLEEKVQICVKEKYFKLINTALTNRQSTAITQAGVEILAIIAYNQPVTRGFIDQIRGVDSYYTLNNLIKRGLIEESGRLDLPGKPLSYKTTDVFLRCFGLSSLNKLPPIPKQPCEETKV